MPDPGDIRQSVFIPSPAPRYAARPTASLQAGNPSVCCRSQLPREHDGVPGPRLRLRLRYRTGRPWAFSGKEPSSPAPALPSKQSFSPALRFAAPPARRRACKQETPQSAVAVSSPGSMTACRGHAFGYACAIAQAGRGRFPVRSLRPRPVAS